MSASYRHPALKHLKDQLIKSTATPDRLTERIDRLECLLDEVDDQRSYPFDYLCNRITGFLPVGEREDLGLICSGKDARHDLRMLLEDLIDVVVIDPQKQSIHEPILTVSTLSERYNISSRTVSRWRQQGLVARKFLIDGRPRVGFLESSVGRFVAAHQDQVERGSKFHFLSDDERDDIIRHARRITLSNNGNLGLIEVARTIAELMDRSTETVRTVIRNFDRDHPDRAIFPASVEPLADEVKTQIFNQHRNGVAVEILAKQHKRTRSSIYRTINEIRANKILSVKLEYMLPQAEDFETLHRDPEARERVLGPFVEDASAKTSRKPKPPKGLPPYLSSLYEVPLLSREHEAHLFRKMNFLKYMADRLRRRINVLQAKTSDLDEIERLQETALAVKNQIISSNLRLVVSIAKRHVAANVNFFDLVSDGNMSLIRAVEKFDYSRGNKFSTYASWAIMKNFARSIPEENYRRDHFVTGHDDMFEAAADLRPDEHECEVAQKRMEEDVKGMLDKLEPREQKIIIARYGINGAKEMTLEQLGKELGITKERVRQIEARAQEKLRRIARDENLDLPN